MGGSIVVCTAKTFSQGKRGGGPTMAGDNLRNRPAEMAASTRQEETEPALVDRPSLCCSFGQRLTAASLVSDVSEQFGVGDQVILPVNASHREI